MFFLNSQLATDSFFVADLEVSKLLLMNDANYPWLILVPRKPDLVELTDLNFDEQINVLREINLCSKILKEKFYADKINVANLGNVVRQLHIHIIARFKDDLTFPKPVWGNAQTKRYNKKAANELVEKIRSFL